MKIKPMRVKPRIIAIERGDLTYFTGKPCVRGHLSERYTSGGVCRSCLREYGERERKRIKEKRQQAQEKRSAAASRALADG